MGKVKFLGRDEILQVGVKYQNCYIDTYFNVCCKYSGIYAYREAFFLVKIIIKLFYNIINLYTPFWCKFHYVTVFMYKKALY